MSDLHRTWRATAAEHVTPEQLRVLVSYDPSTGALTWRPRPICMFVGCEDRRGRTWAMNLWNGQYAGAPALNAPKGNGYRYGTVLRKNVLAHRAAWACFYGEWPDGMIDHMNGIRDDNRIENLRVVDVATNSRNQKTAPKNGWHGVLRINNRWAARIRDNNGNWKHLGMFVAIEDAIAARKAAEIRYWGPNVRT